MPRAPRSVPVVVRGGRARFGRAAPRRRGSTGGARSTRFGARPDDDGKGEGDGEEDAAGASELHDDSYVDLPGSVFRRVLRARPARTGDHGRVHDDPPPPRHPSTDRSLTSAGPSLITSPANPRLRAVAALRDRRERTARRLALVDGAREVRRAIEAGATLVEVYLSTEHRTDAEGRATLEAIEATGVPVVRCGPRAFRRIAYGDRPDGILAVVATPSTALADLRIPPEPLLAVVERVEKPGNLGAIVRSADAAGLDAVLVADGADPFHPNAIRASVSAVFAVPIAVAPPEGLVGWLRERAIRIVAASAEAGISYTEADLRGPLAIVLGSEAAGLGPAWRGPDVTAVRIPMAGLGDSLNVAAAAAVLFFEARRQRGPAPPRSGRRA